MYPTYQNYTIVDYQLFKNFKKMEKKSNKAYCAVDYAFQRIGGKYKGRILWVLRDGLLRYGELKRAVVGITPKMLTQTLKELEGDELISRKVYLEVPPRVEYALTSTGEELIPFIMQMRAWGERQMSLK
jgi:DNA-binding HxlR family transcriptional regulator